MKERKRNILTKFSTKMWKFVFAGCCLLLYVSGIPAPGHGALKGYCKTNSDCRRNECCVSFVQRRGKRNADNTLPTDLRKYVDGKCEKLGKVGSGCFVRDFISPPDIYLDSCPCKTGFTCVGTGHIVVPQGELGTCVRKSKRGYGAKDRP